MKAGLRLYLTGADGMLGTAFTEALRRHPAGESWEVLGTSVTDFDIGDAEAVRKSIDGFRPDVVVHTAAHAIVDDCEADPKLALRVNVDGVRNVVDACRRNRSKLVYVSSDYVFDGRDTPDGGYRETDTPNPLSVYGLTKLAGERTSALVPDHLTIRTSWLFGGADERTDNVLATVRRAVRGERTELIADQFSLPTYTADLADAMTFLLLGERQMTGTLHVANAGTASWYEVGKHALEVFDRTLAAACPPRPAAFDDVAFLGGRPRNSTLSTKLLASLGHEMPSWQNAVERYCAELREHAVGAGAR